MRSAPHNSGTSFNRLLATGRLTDSASATPARAHWPRYLRARLEHLDETRRGRHTSGSGKDAEAAPKRGSVETRRLRRGDVGGQMALESSVRFLQARSVEAVTAAVEQRGAFVHWTAENPRWRRVCHLATDGATRAGGSRTAMTSSSQLRPL
jgi:hypothetical protein